MALFDKLLNLLSKSEEEKTIDDIYYSITKSSSTSPIQTENPLSDDFITHKHLEKIGFLVSSQEEGETNTSSDNNNTQTQNNFFKELQELFKDVTIPEDRVKYYKTVYELYRNFPLAKRIAEQYITSISRVDVLENRCLVFKKYKDLNIDNYDEYYEKVEDIIKLINTYYRIERNIRDKIIKDVVVFGNKFVEILDENEFLNLKLLNENQTLRASKSLKTLLENYIPNKNKITSEDINSIFSLLSENIVDVDLSYLNIYSNNIDNLLFEEDEENQAQAQSQSQQEQPQNPAPDNYDNIKLQNELKLFKDEIYDDIKEISSITVDDLKNIRLIYHEPKNVIILYNEDKIVGYLVIKEETSSELIDITKYLNQIFGKKTDNSIQKESEKLYKKFIDFIVGKILEKFEQNLSKTFENDTEKINYILSSLYKQEKELFYIVKSLFVDSKLKKIKVRYVPPDKMVNFYINSDNYPYGESILSNLVIYAKLYLLSLISNVITKLSRAPLIRKWIVEAGTTLQYGNLTEKLKREIKNQLVTIDSIGSLSAIPRILSDYKDLITISRNGQRFVDFEVIRAGDPSVDTSDIEFYQRDIIALSRVPSPYLGYIDTVELREQLVNANVQFSELISFYQKQLEEKLSELFDKIVYAIKPNIKILPSTLVKIEFIKPAILQLQQLELIFASLSNILQLLLQVPELQQSLDIIKFIEEYVPTFKIKNFIKNEEDMKKQEIESAFSGQNQGQGQEQGGEEGFPPGFGG